MSSIKLKHVCLLLCILYCQVTFAGEALFSQMSFDSLKRDHQGKNWLMVLWSVDCPPCFKELAMIQRLRTLDNQLTVVLINTDDDDEISVQRKRILSDYQVEDLENFYFQTGETDRNRFIIDPHWYGELPRSYFINKQGQFHGKSGLLEETLLKKWFALN